MAIDKLLGRKIFRISLASLIAIIAIFYIALIQYSFTQYEGSWAAFVKENEIRKISDEPGLHFIPMGDQVINLPKSVMIIESRYNLVDIGGSRFNINFNILWRLTNPGAYLDTMISQDKPEKFIMDAVFSEIKKIAGSSDSSDQFYIDFTDLPGKANNSYKIKNTGISIENLYILDFYPYIADMDKSDFDQQSDAIILEKLELSGKIKKQLERDRR